MYLILFAVAYSVYLPPMGRRRSEHNSIRAEWRCSTQQVHGTGSRKRVNDNELTHCSIEQNVTVAGSQTCRHLKNCVRLQMTNFLIKLFPNSTVFCTLCCHGYLQHHNITILGVRRTHILFLDMIAICVTVTYNSDVV